MRRNVLTVTHDAIPGVPMKTCAVETSLPIITFGVGRTKMGGARTLIYVCNNEKTVQSNSLLFQLRQR